jgi:hypothetical protein
MFLHATFLEGFNRIFQKRNIIIEINLKTISHLITSTDTQKDAKTFILLVAKYYIYSCKIGKRTPQFNLFLHYFRSRLCIEKCIAFNRDKLETHFQKWNRIFPDTNIITYENTLLT